MSDYEYLGLSEDFDPKLQLLNYTSVAGDMYITFDDVDWYFHILIKNAIIHGVRLGACGIAMVILWIVSKNRKTPVFFLNQLCLLMAVINSGLYYGYLLGGYAAPSTQFTGFMHELVSQNDLNVYAGTTLFNFFTMICIEISMVFQVKTIFHGPDTKWLSRAVVGLSLIIALATIGLTLYNSVKAVIVTFDDPSAEYASKALNVYPILFASSVNFMSVLLITKLIMAVRARRYLGLKQFDGFHILLIMSTQTLIIPSILLIVSYAVNALERISFVSICTALVALSLPLSSMWATSANDAKTPTSKGYIYTPSGRGTSYFSEPGTATLRVDVPSKHEFDPEKSLYTPSTAAEEEARKYWMADDEDGVDADDGGVLGITTHQINAPQ